MLVEEQRNGQEPGLQDLLRTAGSPVATQLSSARFIRSRRAGSWLD